jgi:PAS domain S-box-containing protein
METTVEVERKNKAAGKPLSNGFARAGRLCLLILSLALIAPGVLAQTPVDMPRTIRVVVDNAYAPYSFQSDDGKLQGILIDQWRAWEKKTGIKVEIVAMDWDEGLRRIRAGEFDVIDSIVETAERRDYFDFTPAYATIETSIFFRKDISGITDLASLKGFPVGVKTGNQQIDKLKANGVTTVILFQNDDAIIKSAAEHKINVFVVDNTSALYLLNKAGIEADFRHSAPIFRDELKRAVRKGDSATLRTVSEGFAGIEPDELKRIDEKWFGLTINRYGRYLAYAGYAAAVAVLLIAGLVGWNRTLRKRILQRTAELGESEQRFRQIAENIHEVFWMSSTGFGGPLFSIIYISPAYESVWGRTCESLYRDPRSFVDAIHPEDQARVVDVIERELEVGFENQYRIIRPDGSMRWIRDRGFPIQDELGHVYRIAGIAEDITARKQAEEQLKATSEHLRALSARLQAAREEEGTRIAREIHDELGAALTSLRWDLEGFDEGISEAGNRPQLQELRQKIEAMMRLTDTTISTVRRIASELRPFALDDVGLTAAIEWQARQFQGRTGIIVQCDCTRDDVDLSREQSTAVFRISQEALTNILRHARATRVNIQIKEGDGEFILTITDNGRGITVEEKSSQRTLGLLGMRERAHLVGGKIEIMGSDGNGTVVTVRIPILKDQSASVTLKR